MYNRSVGCTSVPIPAGNYMFKVNNRNTRTRLEICSKFTMKTPERRQWPVLVFLLLTLSKKMPSGMNQEQLKLSCLICFPTLLTERPSNATITHDYNFQEKVAEKNFFFNILTFYIQWDFNILTFTEGIEMEIWDQMG